MTRTQRLAIVGIVVGLVVVFLFARCAGDDGAEQPDGATATATATSQPPATVPPTVAPSATSGPAGPPQLFDDIYEVGREIEPGVWVTTAPDDHGCYWARLRSFGLPDSIIDDRNLEPGETARVAVKASDAGFKVSNGCRWERAPLS